MLTKTKNRDEKREIRTDYGLGSQPFHHADEYLRADHDSARHKSTINQDKA
jgi:hypothetical protein